MNKKKTHGAVFGSTCYHGNFTGQDNNYFCIKECCILEQPLTCKQSNCKILSIIINMNI